MTITKNDKIYEIVECSSKWNVKLLNTVIRVNFDLLKRDFQTIYDVVEYINKSEIF